MRSWSVILVAGTAMLSGAGCHRGPLVSTDSEGASSSTSSTTTSVAPTSSTGMPDVGAGPDTPDVMPDLPSADPEGCGDGVVTPGQYCFRFVPLPPPDGKDVTTHNNVGVAIDLDGDGIDEVGLRYSSAELGSILRVFAIDDDVARVVADASPFHGTQASDSYIPDQTLDWDRDGRVDLVYMSNSHPGLRFYRQLAAGFGERQGVDLGDWVRGAPFPFNPDGSGTVRLLAMFEAGAQVHAWSGSAWVPDGDLWALPNCGDIFFAVEADVNEDGLKDVLGLGSNAICDPYPDDYDPGFHVMSVFLGRDDDRLEPPYSVPAGTPTMQMWPVDFDGDGHIDVVFTGDTNIGAGAGTFAWIRGRGDGTFEEPEVAVGDWLRGVGDFDGDGDVDLLLSTLGVGTTVIDDFDDLGVVEIATAGSSLSPNGTATLNGDGITDIITGLGVFLSNP